MVLSGAFDSLEPLDSRSYPFIHEAVLLELREGVSAASIESSRVDNKGLSGEELERMDIYQRLVRARNELRYLEMHPSGNPIAILRPEADRYGCNSIEKTIVQKEGSRLRLAVLVSAMRRVPVSKGVVQFATLEDETGLLESILLPLARFPAPLRKPFGCRAAIRDRRDIRQPPALTHQEYVAWAE